MNGHADVRLVQKVPFAAAVDRECAAYRNTFPRSYICEYE